MALSANQALNSLARRTEFGSRSMKVLEHEKNLEDAGKSPKPRSTKPQTPNPNSQTLRLYTPLNLEPPDPTPMKMCAHRFSPET